MQCSQLPESRVACAGHQNLVGGLGDPSEVPDIWMLLYAGREQSSGSLRPGKQRLGL